MRRAPYGPLLVMLFAHTSSCTWDWNAVSTDALPQRSDAGDATMTVDVVADDAGSGCGMAGQPCCMARQTRCNVFATCIEGACVACGGDGQPCCDNGACPVTAHQCIAGTCQRCGTLGLACCGLACDVNTNCQPDLRVCVMCGVRGAVCCDSTGATPCQSGLSCGMDSFGAAICF